MAGTAARARRMGMADRATVQEPRESLATTVYATRRAEGGHGRGGRSVEAPTAVCRVPSTSRAGPAPLRQGDGTATRRGRRPDLGEEEAE